MHAQDFFGLGIGQALDHTRSIAQRAGATVGQEREGTGLVLHAIGLQLLLGLADPGDFRRGVDDPGNGVEVDVTMLTGDTLGHRNAFFFGLVGQHRAAHHVTHCPHIGQIGLAVAVHGDEAALVQLQAHAFGVQADGVGGTADGDDQLVEFAGVGFTLGIGVFHGDAVLASLDGTDLHTQVHRQALLGQQLLGFLGDLLVHGTQEGRQRFQHGHFRTQTTPHRTHFQADDAGADHAQLLRHFGNGQCAGVGEDQLFIELGTRQSAGVGAGGDDDVLGGDGFFGSAGNLDLVAVGVALDEGAATVEEGHLVLLEQVQDAIVVLLDHGILATQHLFQVQTQALDFDAMLGEAVAGVFVVLGRLQQRLGGDATNVGAGTTRCRAALLVLPFVDAGGVEAQLGCTDGGDVAAGAATDDDHVKILAHVCIPDSLCASASAETDAKRR